MPVAMSFENHEVLKAKEKSVDDYNYKFLFSPNGKHLEHVDSVMS